MNLETMPSGELTVSNQRSISRLVAQAGQMLLAHGAESTLVCDIMRRIGLACGVHEVAVALSANALVVTTVMDGHCITTTRSCADRGINMRVITQIQRICIMMERGLLDAAMAQKKLNTISPERYNRWLVVLMIGLSCAAFSHLAGGDWGVFIMTFLASAGGMIVRQEIGHRHFNPLLNFAATAFVTTLISAQAEIYQIGNLPTVAMASSVLMLVPGFPLINSVADMLKGHINMGIARFVMASLLTLATCLGIVAAMSVTGIWGVGNLMNIFDLTLGLLNDMFFAAIPAVGFALVFNVPQRALIYCAVGGAIGHGSRYLMMQFGVPIEWATFFAATLVGMIGVHWSHRFLAHPKVFTVAALIPMVPGVFAYKAMIAMVEINHLGYSPELIATCMENFLKAMFIIAGLAVGLAVPGLLFYRRRPIV